MPIVAIHGNAAGMDFADGAIRLSFDEDPLSCARKIRWLR